MNSGRFSPPRRKKRILDLINTNYDFYMSAARKLDDKVRSQSQPTIRLIEFADFEKQSQSISKLGFIGHRPRESMDTFLADSKKKKSLNYLICLLLVSSRCCWWPSAASRCCLWRV